MHTVFSSDRSQQCQ